MEIISVSWRAPPLPPPTHQHTIVCCRDLKVEARCIFLRVCSNFFCLPESSETQFRVSVFYRGAKVLEQLVENEAGVCLVYRYHSNQALTTSSLSDTRFWASCWRHRLHLGEILSSECQIYKIGPDVCIKPAYSTPWSWAMWKAKETRSAKSFINMLSNKCSTLGHVNVTKKNISFQHFPSPFLQFPG